MGTPRTPRYRHRYRPVTAGAASYAETNADPNVAALWIFDEASGDIVDEIASLTLADSGTPTYSQSFTGSWAGTTPGIRCSPGASESAFAIAGEQAALNLGTGSGVVEWFARFDDATSPFVGGSTTAHFWNTQAVLGQTGYFMYLTEATSGYNFEIWATDGSSASMTLNDPHSGTPPWTSDIGNTHKWRLVINRAGNVELFYDGTSLGSASLAAVSGKTVNTAQVKVGGRHDTFRPMDITYTTLRFTIGNTTNNLGGPGGG